MLKIIYSFVDLQAARQIIIYLLLQPTYISDILKIRTVSVISLSALCLACREVLLSVKQATLLNRAYPENANFTTCAPSTLKFHKFGGLHQTKIC